MEWLDTLDHLVTGPPHKMLDLYGHWRNGEYTLKLHWEVSPKDHHPGQAANLVREAIARPLEACRTYHMASDENHEGPENVGFVTDVKWNDRVLWLIQVNVREWHAVFTPVLPSCPDCGNTTTKDGFCRICKAAFRICPMCGNIIRPGTPACTLCADGASHRCR